MTKIFLYRLKNLHQNYTGDFGGTPFFIGTSNPGAHVPVERVEATATILKDMNADLTLKIYKNLGHTTSQDEINLLNNLILHN